MQGRQVTTSALFPAVGIFNREKERGRETSAGRKIQAYLPKALKRLVTATAGNRRSAAGDRL